MCEYTVTPVQAPKLFQEKNVPVFSFLNALKIEFERVENSVLLNEMGGPIVARAAAVEEEKVQFNHA